MSTFPIPIQVPVALDTVQLAVICASILVGAVLVAWSKR